MAQLLRQSERIDWYRKDDPRLVICCDSPTSKRKEMCSTYKSNRPPKPQDAIESIVSVQDRLRAWGVAVVQCDGYEADDLISGLVEQAWPERVRVIGSEKDLFCLISDTVHLIGKNGPLHEADCEEKFGVKPHMMPDWLALVGDAADCIAGCPNCGPGRAADLLQRFGTLEAIRAASDEEIRSVRGIGPKTLTSLREWDPSMALKLVQLMTDAPINLGELFNV